MSKSIGMICLVIFLIVFGILQITNIKFEGENLVLGGSAILAGVFLLLNK